MEREEQRQRKNEKGDAYECVRATWILIIVRGRRRGCRLSVVLSSPVVLASLFRQEIETHSPAHVGPQGIG